MVVIKWALVVVVTIIWLYYCKKANKEKHRGEWVTLGLHEMGKALRCLGYTFVYAIFWIIWLIIF